MVVLLLDGPQAAPFASCLFIAPVSFFHVTFLSGALLGALRESETVVDDHDFDATVARGVRRKPQKQALLAVSLMPEAFGIELMPLDKVAHRLRRAGFGEFQVVFRRSEASVWP